MSYTKTRVFETSASTKSAIAIPAWAQQMIDNGGELNTTVDAYNKTPQLYRAVQMRSNAIASIPFVITKGNKPVPWMYPQSLPKLLFEMEASLLVSGAAYLLKLQPATGGNRTVGLQVLMPASMTVEYDYHSKQVLFTQQIRNQRFGPWTADRLVYMREFSFVDEVGAGLAPAKVALHAASLRQSMSDFARGFFSSGGQPLTLLSMQGNPPPTEIERTEKFFRRTMAGVRNAWRVLAVRSEVTVTPITPQLSSMAMEELQTVTTREIAAAFGIPLSLLTSDSANYATAVSDQRLFYDNTVKARIALYETALNEQLLHETQTEIQFTPESLSIYQEDEAERSGALVNMVNAGVPLRDAMLILGYSVEEVTGIDATMEAVSNAAPVAVIKKKIPATVSLQEQLSNEYANATHAQQVKSELRTWQRVTAKSIERGREFECLQIPSELEIFIKSHLQESDAYLEHVFEDGGVKSLVLQTKAEKAVAAKVRAVFKQYGNQIKAKAGRGIVDHTATEEMFSTLAKRITPVLTNVYSTQIRATEAETGVALDTERYKTAAQEWAEKYSYGELKTRLETSTISNVQRMVSKLVQDPSLTPAMVAAGLFPTFSDYRVAMIATTEVTRAKSAAVNGYYDGLTDDGIDVVRRWTTQLNERVCPICAPLDNKKEETYKKKFNDGPPAHPNCRCRIGVEVKADNTEEGRGEVTAPAIPKPKPAVAKPKAPPVVVKPPIIIEPPIVAPAPASTTGDKTGKETLKAMLGLSTTPKGLKAAQLAQEEKEHSKIYRAALRKGSVMNGDDYEEFAPTIEKLKLRMEDIETDLALLRSQLRTEATELLFVKDYADLKLEGDTPKPHHRRAYEFAAKLISMDAMDGRELIISTTYAPVQRASSNGTQITLNRNTSVKTAVHEVGHNLDYQGFAVRKGDYRLVQTGIVSKEYLYERTVGETAQKLMDLKPEDGYEDFEVTRKDKFEDPYSGVVYNKKAESEILSMSMGYLYDDPVHFAETDPELFKFAINILRGYPNDGN